jgi:hypothetical protein
MMSCTVRRADFRGWDACFLENDFIRLVTVPDIGGRVMAYDLGTYPFLFVDPDLAGKLFSPEENLGDGSLGAWKNYGGAKTWPAPQGWDNDQQWHGPPDPVLDTGRYRLEALQAKGAAAAVRMASPPDPRTGVQIVRSLRIGAQSTRVHLTLTFRNTTDHPIRWSIWDVTQLRAERRLPDGATTYDRDCVVTARVNPGSRFPKGFNVMFGAADNPQWQVENGLFRAPYLWQIGKVGLDSTTGWIAFHNGSEGATFVERFAHASGAEYPDGGATVECWTVGAGQVANLDYAASGIYLMETEVLGPLRTIAPGRETRFRIEWGACRCAGPIVRARVGGDAGCVAVPLMATVTGKEVYLTGSFGVFDKGRLILLLNDDDGSVLRQQELGPVDPLGAVQVDHTAPLPTGATAAVLRVERAVDGKSQLLDLALIERQ